MATMKQAGTRTSCPHCGAYYSIESHELPLEDWQSPYAMSKTGIKLTPNCHCDAWTDNINKEFSIAYPKEPTVAQEFDTTPVKNTALSAIKQRVEEVERALFAKQQAVTKVELEHHKLIEEASLALDRVLAEAHQNGVVEEDFEKNLPDYSDELTDRLYGIFEVMSLANVKESV